jgi:hypothetical protein
MHRSFVALVVAAFVLAPCAAVAADQTSGNSSAPVTNSATTTATDDNQMVCHREKLTGTLLPGPQVCKSLKVWRQQQEESKEYMNGVTIRNDQMNPPGS